MRASFLIFLFGCVSPFVGIQAAKTITISSPSCKLNTVIEVPTTKCCCATPTIAPPLSPPVSKNTVGCPSRFKYGPPTCVVASPYKYRGSECSSYFQCTGPNKSKETVCDLSTFSEKQQACVPHPTNFKLCCVE
ncbi:hypothetical protein PPYR_00570 [Photinus pyralis]|uniref:Chitin-binding type-2 domain-containing protein n=1 Tax=Photinus pyralis TaxID=7054 RepID=A0A5N4B2I2_PHOPY|nr:hypothetical protein PPYR_00570 [Photinus pyralis]